MYEELLEKANKWASLSCKKSNKNRLSRVVNRLKYQRLTDKYLRSDAYAEKRRRYFSGDYTVDTYPWPYCDPGFADWAGSDKDEDYSLVADRSKLVIKHPASYCAWKIYELTGRRLQSHLRALISLQQCVDFLLQSGYDDVVEKPVDGEHYVGVTLGRVAGQMIWFERTCRPLDSYYEISPNSQVIASTYSAGRHVVKVTDPNKYCWVKIA